jgi:hypothetical protein
VSKTKLGHYQKVSITRMATNIPIDPLLVSFESDFIDLTPWRACSVPDI